MERSVCDYRRVTAIIGIAKQLHETSLAAPYRNPSVGVTDSGEEIHWMDFGCIHQNVDHTLISNQTPSAQKL